MKVLLINGSPRANGNTALALSEMEKAFAGEGIEVENIHVGGRDVRGCVACNRCRETGACAFDDVVNEAAGKFEAADGIVVASPVYYGGPNATVTAFLDRLFYSHGAEFDGKPGACAVVCRRGGASAAFDRLNKYFTISNMPVVPSQYWNSVHGAAPGEAAADAEGLQTMRTLADNLAWMIDALPAPPARQPHMRTSFIR